MPPFFLEEEIDLGIISVSFLGSMHLSDGMSEMQPVARK